MSALDELVASDEDCLRLADVFLASVHDHPSSHGHRLLQKTIETAQERARALGALDRSDDLLRRHLVASWDFLAVLARFRFDRRGTPVRLLVDALAGEGALDRLQTFVSSLDQEACWRYLECRHVYRKGRMASEDGSASECVADAARSLLELFRSWLRTHALDLPGTDAEVVVGPLDADRSWYEPDAHRVVLGGAEFMVFDRQDGPFVNCAVALRSLAHELCGHAVQNALSRGLPLPLQPDDRSDLRPAGLPAAEGYAILAASLALACARDRGSELRLSATDQDLLSFMDELTGLHHGVPALVKIALLRAEQEKGFDASGWLTSVAGHPGFGELLLQVEPWSLRTLLYDASCFFGQAAARAAAARLEANGLDRRAVLSRLGRGAWALPVYAEAMSDG